MHIEFEHNNRCDIMYLWLSKQYSEQICRQMMIMLADGFECEIDVSANERTNILMQMHLRIWI